MIKNKFYKSTFNAAPEKINMIKCIKNIVKTKT